MGRYDRLVLYVATVHYKSPLWIEIQTRYLREHISVPFQVWTSLEGIDSSYSVNFDRVLEQVGPHAGKLNHLAMEICHEAEDQDLLMFLDGDAFPIADPMPVIGEALAKAPLVAVRRDEHMRDPQPHPCFCVTTVGAWRSLPGDWSIGYAWYPRPESRGWSDVGANLLRQLELTDTPWVDLLRTNPTSLDPLYFAIYGDVVYHHGSSFRPTTLSGEHQVSDQAPRPLRAPPVPVLDRAVRVLDRRRRQAWERKLQRRRGELSRTIYERIKAGDPRWLEDISGQTGAAGEPRTLSGSRGSS
jgi:hypothetical protein